MVECLCCPFLQLAASLTSLADSFVQFHRSGVEHHKAGISVVQGLQEVASHCDNNRGSTIAGPMQKVGRGLESGREDVDSVHAYESHDWYFVM